MREFDSGSTRNDDTEALDFEGFLSPLVLQRYAMYMHKHRLQKDGKVRPSDNWQKGIPLDSYMKSGWRHMFDWWSEHRHAMSSRDGLEDALCAVIFNAMGYLHELLKAKPEVPKSALEPAYEQKCQLCELLYYDYVSNKSVIFCVKTVSGKHHWIDRYPRNVSQ